jgi:adenylosuccinate synthase
MLNDFDSYNLTKLDVLDNFEEIQIGVSYKINGQKIDYMPSTIEEYA